MAEPILKLTRGVPKTDREWMDVFSKITKHLRVDGDRLVISTPVELPPSAAASVLGRAASTPGAPTDIIAASDGTYLKRTSGVLSFTTIDDDDIPAAIARTADVTDAINHHVAALDPHSQYLLLGETDARYPQATSGTFTAMLTGCTTSPTGTCRYVKNGSMVVLHIPSITATSNTTAATLTGIPAAITPLNAQTFIGRTVDNGTNNVARNVIETSSIITLTASIAGAAFTAAGTKGWGDTVFAYLLT